MSDQSFACEKCPRTFKLVEFYEKHKKVHELKKQHRCDVCGFVYGAAKGLEGHIKTHTTQELAIAVHAANLIKPNPLAAPVEVPFDINFHFLNPQGVLAKAPQAAAAAIQPPQQPPAAARREKSLSASEMVIQDDRMSASPAPQGTGNYEIYESVPELHDPNLLSQNEGGFFMCSICKREFSGVNSLKKHVPIHTRRVQHKCDVCGFVFGKKEYLMDHLRTHTGELSPSCEICGQTFVKSLKLKEHFKLHRNTNADGSLNDVLPFRCHVCQERFQQAVALGNHLAMAHASEVRSEQVHKCPACNQGFARPHNLKSHMLKVHGQEWVDNNFSPEEFAALVGEKVNKANGAAQHYYDQRKNSQVLSCQLCQDKFVRRSDMLIHMESAHRIPLSGGSPFAGDLSMGPRSGQKNIVYDDNEPPMITIKPIRQVSPPAAARKPGPASRTNAPAENRVLAAANAGGVVPSYLDSSQFDASAEGYKCGECDKVLQHKQSYVSHMRVIHGNYYGGNKWKGHSSVVDMILDESSKLSPKKSKGKSGADANATMCSVCESVFPNTSSLRNHVVNVHIQGQSFTCDLCGKAFLSQENLDTHTKSKHPNLNKRLQSLRDALGLPSSSSDEPDAKRPRLTEISLQSGISSDGPTRPEDTKPTLLPSNSVLSISAVMSSSSLSLSSTPITVDFPVTSKDYMNNNNNNNDEDCPLDLSRNSTVVITGPPPDPPLPPPPLPPPPTSESVLSSSVVTVQTSQSSDAANNNNEAADSAAQAAAPTSGRKKNSICKICGVVLSPKTNVNVHMRTHSGARPYQCVLCLNKFRQKAHLMKHFRCSHNQKKPPFVCLFCPDECASSNDLYRHITDKHKKETDDLLKANGLQREDEEGEEENVEEPLTVQVKQEDSYQAPKQQTPFQEGAAQHGLSLSSEPYAPPNQGLLSEAATSNNPAEEHQGEAPQQQSVTEPDDDTRYEPIMEAFFFEDQIIHPCYCILPFIEDHQVEAICKRPIADYYGEDSDEQAGQEDEEEEEGQLTIDESQLEGSEDSNIAAEEEEEEMSPPPNQEEVSPMLESLLHQSRETGLSGEEMMHKPDNGNTATYNAEDIKVPNPTQGFYPNLSDYSLPFSLSSLWKKKADILTPEALHQLEMIRKMEEIKELNANASEKARPAAPASKPKPAPKPSPKGGKVGGGYKGGDGSVPSQVSDYESQIQNDHWPADCIKCGVRVGNLESFNVHMNDHWSEDKCCPVCGLLINSKRFNFKQHLKIHTGEKPFVCKFCSRSFRQKAHMVKHMTTHRNSDSNMRELAV